MPESLDGALTIDKNAVPVQILELDTVASIAVATTSANTNLPSGVEAGDLVRIAATTNCYIVFGGTADSNDHLFIQGVEYFRVPEGVTQLAAIRVDSDGALTISRMK